MSESDAGEVMSEVPGQSIGDRVISTVKTVYDRYTGLKVFIGQYLPYVERTVEVIMAAVLFIGFSYWFYLYFIVGT